MSLSLEDIRRIAYLARLAVTDAEAAAVRGELNGIFALVEQLKAVDTRGIEPMSHTGAATLRLRADEVTEVDQHQVFQAIAPQVDGNLYLVPKVIE